MEAKEAIWRIRVMIKECCNKKCCEEFLNAFEAFKCYTISSKATIPKEVERLDVVEHDFDEKSRKR